jgi:hypothetical protein
LKHSFHARRRKRRSIDFIGNNILDTHFRG